MHLARVIGTVVASRKDAGRSGWMRSSFMPLRPASLRLATTVPITRARCISP